MDLLAFRAEADQLRALPPITDDQPVRTAEQVLTAIADPIVEWPEDDGEAAALADSDDDGDGDLIRWQVMCAVIAAMITDSCWGTAWDAVHDALAPHGHLFISMLFYGMRVQHLRPLVRDAAVAAVTAAGEPCDSDEAYRRATEWLRPTVDQLQNSAVDLLAAMAHPPTPFVLAYQPEPELETEPWWVARAFNRFGRVRKRPLIHDLAVPRTRPPPRCGHTLRTPGPAVRRRSSTAIRGTTPTMPTADDRTPPDPHLDGR